MFEQKTSGIDSISFEFFKNLLSLGWDCLLRLFNSVIANEKVPASWGKIVTLMLPKAGDPNNFNNFPCIALLNCLTKVFTVIMNNRLKKWAEQEHVIPEFQSGFSE